MGPDDPKALLNAVFYLNGRNFALRDCEQFNLKISQLTRVNDPDGYMYMENGSKNRSGGFQDFKVPNKRVTSHATGGERCHVYLLDLYLSKLPVEAFQEDHLYMRPLLAIPPAAYMPWFVKTKLGQNACTKMVQEMAEAAGLTSKKSNHSLRVTTATTLFSKGVPEKLVQEHTGHHSLTALRMYKHTSAEQEQSVRVACKSWKEAHLSGRNGS